VQGNEYCGYQDNTAQCLPKDTAGCGAIHQACCKGACNDSLSCVSNTCYATAVCGGQGQACCTGNRCNDSLSCINNTCQATAACGGNGQACCIGGTCQSNLNCVDSVCRENANTNKSPFFVSYGTNITTMTQSDILTFSLILNHPNGVHDILGGTLMDPDGGTYGTFVATTTTGAYTLSLTWPIIDIARRIEFPAGGANRVFRATFFDTAGNTAVKDFTIKLVCSNASHSACNGKCTSVQTDIDNCGQCGKKCSPPTDWWTATCSNSKCVDWTCSNVDRLQDCNSVCSAIGKVCFAESRLYLSYRNPNCEGSYTNSFDAICTRTTGNHSVMCPCL